MIPREFSIEYSPPQSGPERVVRSGGEQDFIGNPVLIERCFGRSLAPIKDEPACFKQVPGCMSSYPECEQGDGDRGIPLDPRNMKQRAK